MPPLPDLPAFDDQGCLNVIIETPKGSRNKYGLDEALGLFRFKTVLPEGSSFPYDFGLVPSTKGEDGDPLDILVLLDAPVVVGCLLAARPVGVIEAEQTEQDGETMRNDRLLAVAVQARTHVHVHGLADLRPGLLDEVEAFFAHYNALSGRRFKPLGRGGPEKARALVEEAITRAKRGD